MKLIVGLGNPGAEYERTRHNAGYLVLDALAERHARGAVPRARFQSVTVEVEIPASRAGGGFGASASSGAEPPARALLMKPTTYMNRSGQAVAEAVRFYKVSVPDDLLVVTDDIYLPGGAIRLRPSGGSGGHNGLTDIQRLLGVETWARCRIGVDAPGIVPQSDYVLGRFSAEQWERVGPAIKSAADAAEVWATQGIDAAMNRFNTKEAAAPGPTPAPKGPVGGAPPARPAGEN